MAGDRSRNVGVQTAAATTAGSISRWRWQAAVDGVGLVEEEEQWRTGAWQGTRSRDGETVAKEEEELERQRELCGGATRMRRRRDDAN